MAESNSLKIIDDPELSDDDKIELLKLVYFQTQAEISDADFGALSHYTAQSSLLVSAAALLIALRSGGLWDVSLFDFSNPNIYPAWFVVVLLVLGGGVSLLVLIFKAFEMKNKEKMLSRQRQNLLDLMHRRYRAKIKKEKKTK